MLETYLRSAVTRRRLHSGPAAHHVDAFADWLCTNGYQPISIENTLRSLAGWTDWMLTAGFTAQHLLPAFAAGKAAIKGKQSTGRRHGLNRHSLSASSLFIRFLQHQGELPPPIAPPSALDLWPILSQFCSWMRKHRGLTESTLAVYQGILSGLLETLGDDPRTYSAEALRAFVLDRARPHRIQRAKSIVVAVRSFVRFLGVTSQCAPALEQAIPGFASWQLSSVPRFLVAEDVERAIGSCTEYRFALRDRAVLLLLTRLGLRASEVAQLRFTDIDWAKGVITVTEKAGVKSPFYDILNRLSATAQYSYSYSPGDNKRMAVYSSSGTSATAWFNIYDPNGRKLGVYTYTATAPWSKAQFQPGLSKNIWYLGSKRIDISEDQVGSNWDQTQYYPWGQVQAGQQPSETQGFGTYVLDSGSGLYYADQRYYNQNWGRFQTADPSDSNIDPSTPGSWNRFAYTNGDPINRFDPRGLTVCDSNGDNCYDSVDVESGDPDDMQTVDEDFWYPHQRWWGPTSVFPSNWGQPNCRVPFPGGNGSQIVSQNVQTAQDTYNKLAASNPQDPSAAVSEFLGWLSSQFTGAWNYKTEFATSPTPSDPTGTDNVNYFEARKFGNFDFGAILQSLGFSEYLTQNAAGAAQIGICVGGGDCGNGVPFIQFPYGDQATDQFDIQRGWLYQSGLANGNCP